MADLPRHLLGRLETVFLGHLPMSTSKLALFLSGLFFGGAIDHAILGSLGRAVTPYGLESGVVGNWLLAGIDLVLAAGLYRVHQSREQKRTRH